MTTFEYAEEESPGIEGDDRPFKMIETEEIEKSTLYSIAGIDSQIVKLRAEIARLEKIKTDAKEVLK